MQQRNHLKLVIKTINLSTEKGRVHLDLTDWESFVIPSPPSNYIAYCISSFGKYRVLSLQAVPMQCDWRFQKCNYKDLKAFLCNRIGRSGLKSYLSLSSEQHSKIVFLCQSLNTESVKKRAQFGSCLKSVERTSFLDLRFYLLHHADKKFFS